MAQYWIIDGSGYLANTIEWDGSTPLLLDAGFTTQLASGPPPSVSPAEQARLTQIATQASWVQAVKAAQANLATAAASWLTLTTQQKDAVANVQAAMAAGQGRTVSSAMVTTLNNANATLGTAIVGLTVVTIPPGP